MLCCSHVHLSRSNTYFFINQNVSPILFLHEKIGCVTCWNCLGEAFLLSTQNFGLSGDIRKLFLTYSHAYGITIFTPYTGTPLLLTIFVL